MQIVFLLALALAIALIPIIVGARVVGARNTGFGTAILAALALTALNKTVEEFIVNQILAVSVLVAGSAMLLAWVLGTTFARGLLVGVIVIMAQIVGLAAMASLFPDLVLPRLETPDFSP